MAVEDHNSPSTPEIKKQLERLLLSKALRSSPSQAKLLQFVVESALANEEITEKTISLALFPFGNYDPETSIVRATASHLRKTLAKHYAGIGGEDDVVIELPPGKLYRPMFAWNANWEIHSGYRYGLAHMKAFRQGGNQQRAWERFTKIIEFEPSYAPAYAARAEVEFREAIYCSARTREQWLCFSRKFPWHWVAAAEESAREALRLNPKTWRAHIVLGAVHCSRFDWDLANKSFEAAKQIALLETEEHLYYLAFVAATGKLGEAIWLAVRALERRGEEDVFAKLTLATLYYLSADETHRTNWAYKLTMAAIKEDNQVPHGYVIEACIEHSAALRSSLAGSCEGWVTSWHKLYGEEAFEGLAIFCFGQNVDRTKDPDEQAEMRKTLRLRIAGLERKSQESYVPHVQLALAHLGAKEMDEAVFHLGRAIDEGDPKMAWLHLWPLFDSLREHEGFKALISRMKLPYSP